MAETYIRSLCVLVEAGHYSHCRERDEGLDKMLPFVLIGNMASPISHLRCNFHPSQESSIIRHAPHFSTPANAADHGYKDGHTAFAENEELRTVSRQGKAISNAPGRTAQLKPQQCGVHEHSMAEHERDERQYSTRFRDVGDD